MTEQIQAYTFKCTCIHAYIHTYIYTYICMYIYDIYIDMHTDTYIPIAAAEVQSLDCAQTWLLLSCGELRPSELLLAALAKVAGGRRDVHCSSCL